MNYLITSYRNKEQKEIIEKKGLYCYDLRLNEEGNKFIAIEKEVEYDRGGSIITDEKLKFPDTQFTDFIDFEEFISKNNLVEEMKQLSNIEQEIKKALFNTKIASEMKHNGEVVDILDFKKGKDTFDDRYVVRFNDDTISNNIMAVELEFEFIRDSVQEDTRRKLSMLMKKYELSDKEIEELQTAVANYDYEANEGVVFTSIKSIEMLFTEENEQTPINPSEAQLKAMAEYIDYTKDYYMLYGYEEYTKKVINSILEKNDISRLEFLNEIKDMINHNIMCYSENNLGEKGKKGYENEFSRENKKLVLINEIIKEEKQKEKVKIKNKEVR